VDTENENITCGALLEVNISSILSRKAEQSSQKNMPETRLVNGYKQKI
jgi:hypothetical protein